MDKNLKCKDCGAEFVFTEGEQKFYTEKNFPDPIRCPECRKVKKSKSNGKNNNKQ
ncbi:MAG: zinc-ribbon domain-containing protein [Candidatus Caldatribacteriota bacterium]|nr:zinc-ribbon domain-containing protein [Patescibacteria group bacterium]